MNNLHYYNKIFINVPKGLDHISNWKDIDTRIFRGHCILNKFLTGCGFTTYCLINQYPIILCSPRKFLLENKAPDFPDAFVVNNKNENTVEYDSTFEDRSNGNLLHPIKPPKVNTFSDIMEIKDSIKKYIVESSYMKRIPKIMVTYDSSHYVIEVLKELNYLNSFNVVVDEFQNILMDSCFKSDTELNFVEWLQDCPNVLYLSATPHIEEYLLQLKEFKNLPYYEYVWDPSQILKPHIQYVKTLNPSRNIDRIILKYRSGQFDSKVVNGVTYLSKEAVFYVNDVSMICSIIKRNNLLPSECNVICSKTNTRNIDKLKKLKFTIGSAPKLGEPHKMFTFCTRTVYAGADFYSPCAKTFIVSNCAIDSLVVDIRLDIPQIMGRQRREDNPFKDEAVFYYKLDDLDITMDDYAKIKDKKLKLSELGINSINTAISAEPSTKDFHLSNIRLRVKSLRYKQDYIGINEKTGNLQVNKLYQLHERRTWEIRSGVYKSDYYVYREASLANIDGTMMENENILEKEYSDIIGKFRLSTVFSEKMKIVCDYLESLDARGFSYDVNKLDIDLNYRNYLNQLAKRKIKALKYRQTPIMDYINSKNKNNTCLNLGNLLSGVFKVGNRYLLSDIKTTLQKIYDDNGIQKTAKASDLENWFDIRFIKINNNGKRENGYEILKIK